MLGIKKEDELKLGTIALIAIFMLSTVAVYMGGYFSGSGENAPEQITSSFTGLAHANASIASWDPSLYIIGGGERLSEKIKQLKGEGLILYDTKTSDGRLIMLTSTDEIVRVSQEIEAAGATAYSDATIYTGNPLQVTDGQGKIVEIEGQNLKQRMIPVLSEGEKFPAEFQVQVVNSKIYAYGEILAVPDGPFSAIATPINATVLSYSLNILIPWEQRGKNYSTLSNSLSGATINYTPKSYVTFNPPLARETLVALSAQKPAYALSIQSSIMAVSPKFFEKETIVQEFEALGISPVFPDSVLSIFPGNGTQITSAAASAAFEKEFENTPAQITPAYVLELTLPKYLEHEGKNYSIGEGRKIELISQIPPVDEGAVELQFRSIGAMVVDLSAGKYASAPELEGEVINIDDLIEQISQNQTNENSGSESGEDGSETISGEPKNLSEITPPYTQEQINEIQSVFWEKAAGIVAYPPANSAEGNQTAPDGQ
ncbi:hypothetical protein COU37_01935 [Candidatus Micrarchaeota archaeon CG10_big_fil_rev_8_21_14_0_10_45_29]|nr:MAG: hypothetical protein COU37_01935 [Candidatus Micrarchaeota archaeon CG10_big_fil_rev_8_21_14_0_10_45_29]